MSHPATYKLTDTRILTYTSTTTESIIRHIRRTSTSRIIIRPIIHSRSHSSISPSSIRPSPTTNRLSSRSRTINRDILPNRRCRRNISRRIQRKDFINTFFFLSREVLEKTPPKLPIPHSPSIASRLRKWRNSGMEPLCTPLRESNPAITTKTVKRKFIFLYIRLDLKSRKCKYRYLVQQCRFKRKERIRWKKND